LTARKRIGRERKELDEEHAIRCRAGVGLIREEVWKDERDRVTRYNLAFICHSMTSKDNGRVLGYDNRHGHHHRHSYGAVESIAFEGYEKLFRRFIGEVSELCRRER
jgi:hypothetical protein